MKDYLQELKSQMIEYKLETDSPCIDESIKRLYKMLQRVIKNNLKDSDASSLGISPKL